MPRADHKVSGWPNPGGPPAYFVYDSRNSPADRIRTPEPVPRERTSAPHNVQDHAMPQVERTSMPRPGSLAGSLPRGAGLSLPAS
jgi:hypothetical protein